MSGSVCVKWASVVVASVAVPALAGMVALPGGKVVTQGNPVGADLRIHSVTMPILRLIHTATPSPKGIILLCPGGGYSILAIDHEGVAVAALLTREGYDVAILEYTIAKGAATRDQALKDVLDAWRLIRTKGAALGFQGGRLGVMGFSAGGHLVARMVSKLTVDEQPDDVILVYPAYLEETAPGTVVPAVQPPKHPEGRLFVLIAENDNSGWVTGCRQYVEAWKDARGEARLEILKDGGHGFGLKADLPGDAKRWPGLLSDFLRSEPRMAVQYGERKLSSRQFSNRALGR